MREGGGKRSLTHQSTHGHILQMEKQPLASWPDHMQSVFRVIGRLMNGKRLSPEVLERLPYEDGSIVAEHRVLIIHTSAAELQQKSGMYTIQITGQRIDGRWNMRSGELEKLSREAAC
jgi:hypothetical protein